MGSHDGAKEHFTTHLFGRFADLSAAEEVSFVVPSACQLLFIQVASTALITTGDATVTVKNLADEVLATVVVPFTGAAAGDVVRTDVVVDTPLAEGDIITVETDGGSTVVSVAPFCVGLLRD